MSLTPAVFVTYRYGAEYSSFERQLAVYSVRGGSEGKGVEAVALPIFFFFVEGPSPLTFDCRMNNFLFFYHGQLIMAEKQCFYARLNWVSNQSVRFPAFN